MEKVVNDVGRVRRRRNISQKQLADTIGVSQQTISDIERGTHEPGIGAALAIARALGCKVEEVFYLDGGYKKCEKVRPP